MFQLYFVTRTNHEARLDEPTGEAFYRLIQSAQAHPPGELRQIEALLDLDLSIFQSVADEVEFPVGQLRYELLMARRHGEPDRAARLEAQLNEVLRREALNLEGSPGAGWFEIEALKDVVERWRDQVAAHPEYAAQLHFPTGWQWGDYFSPTPPASPEDDRLLSDLDQLAEYIERAISLGETHATFQLSI
ncbi:MAG: hypothetical protein ICV83_11120 [Cytophagales bacterium]|nr:hypothetical protein [Cytophagales bacterium]